MTTNAALQDILERQAETIAHAGEQLAEAMTGSTCGVTVVRGLRRDMGRMKEQVQALVSQQWAGAGRHPGRPGWMVRNLVCDLLTRPESESPAARTLLLADTLAELGSCVEELALTLRLRQCGTNFSSAAVYLADALRTLGILVRAARTGALPAQECALLQEYLRRLHEQHWQLLADAGGTAGMSVSLEAGRAFAACAGVVQSAAEATLLLVNGTISGDNETVAAVGTAFAPVPGHSH